MAEFIILHSLGYLLSIKLIRKLVKIIGNCLFSIIYKLNEHFPSYFLNNLCKPFFFLTFLKTMNGLKANRGKLVSDLANFSTLKN